MTDPHFPSKSQMKRREIQCTTHHNACDCREAKFKRMEEFIADLKDEVSETEDLAYQLNENSKAVEKEVERLRKELAEQCRVNGMGAEREAKLLTEIERLKKEKDAVWRNGNEWQAHWAQAASDHATTKEKLAIAVEALERIENHFDANLRCGCAIVASDALEKLK